MSWCFVFLLFAYFVDSGRVIASVEEERAGCLTFEYLYSCRRCWGDRVLFLWVIEIGFDILLWHSLDLSYSYLARSIGE